MESVSVDSIWKHASVLAHDSLEGRGTGTPGGARAAQYIAVKLREYGVRPGNGQRYFQDIPMHGSVPLPESKLTLSLRGAETVLALQRDYVLYKTGAQTHIPRPLRLVFVGYGIVAPEFDYNDYQNLDVAGAVVVFLEGEPISDDDEYFSGRRPTLHSLPEMKQRVALSRGARGSIMLPVPRESPGYTWKDWVRIFSFEDVTLPITVPSHLSILLNPERANLLFHSVQYSYADVLRMDSTGRMRSFPLEVQLRFVGVFRERDFIAHNVAGVLEGSEALLRDSWIICCAHYDHLGIGPSILGDSVYNGLVDNALGTAAVMELARVLSIEKHRPRRSILFLFVTGEEKGLLGSSYYCMDPLVPLHKTVATLNVDGLAIIDEFHSITGVGSEYSTMQELLVRIAEELGLSVSRIPPVFDLVKAFASSDQIAFAQAGIPSMLVMEGFSWRNIETNEGLRRFIAWGRERYHTPFDDLSQPISLPAVRQHAKVLLACLSALADTFEPPQWIRGTKYINARLQSIAEER